MPSHAHNEVALSGYGYPNNWVGNDANVPDSNIKISTSGGYVNNTNWTGKTGYQNQTALTGGGQPHNNIQPSEVDCWIIKASKTTSTPITSEVTNTYSESENNVYSCNYINNLASPKYLLATISTNGYIAHTDFSDFVLTEIENNTDNKLVIKNNKIVVKKNIKHIRVSGTVFCEGLENNAYIWGILHKGTTAFTDVINSGSYFQSVVFPAKIIRVTTNDTIYGEIQASGTSNVSVRAGKSTAWLLVEILD